MASSGEAPCDSYRDGIGSPDDPPAQTSHKENPGPIRGKGAEPQVDLGLMRRTPGDCADERVR